MPKKLFYRNARDAAGAALGVARVAVKILAAELPEESPQP